MTASSLDTNTILLVRRAYLPEGTLGVLSLPHGFVCYTVEKPWLDNKPFSSCIPEGTYPLVWHQSSRFGKLYPVGPKLDLVPDRSQILIHPANLPSEVQGCIAPGLTYSFVGVTPKVTSSVDAFTIIMQYLGVTRLGESIGGKQIRIESILGKLLS